MKLHPSLAGTIAAISVAGLASAQTPSPVPNHEHAASASGSVTQAASANHSEHLTFAGCLMRHKDVLAAYGGTSSGGASGYFLVDVGIVSHHQNLAGMRSPAHNTSGPPANDAPQPATSGRAVDTPVGSPRERIAGSLMFKLTGVPLERLAKMNGRRVQVAGHIDPTTIIDTHAEPNRRPPDVPDAATLVAMSVQPIDGACPKP